MWNGRCRASKLFTPTFSFLAILQEAPKDSKQEQPEKKEEPKFQAFTGKKYSLRG